MVDFGNKWGTYEDLSSIPKINKDSGGGLLDWSKNNVGAIGSALQGAGGLANAYIGYKQYGLAKDAFKFQKKAYNRNIENQGKMINNQMENRLKVGLAMAGADDETKARELEALEDKYVNTDKIK